MASHIEFVYNRSPIFVQAMLVNAWGFAWYTRRNGAFFRKKVAELHANERLSAREFEKLQLDALNRLLEQAQNSSYYRQVLNEAQLKLPIRSLDELQQLPKLNKQTLRSRPTDLLTRKPPRGTKVLNSSGTTGTPTDIYYTKQFHQEYMAYFQARLRDWAGIKRRDKRAMFGVRRVCSVNQLNPPFWRYSYAENLAYYSIYHLSKQNIPYYVKHLRDWQPKLIMGYPSALNIIAQHLIEEGEMINAKAVITTSETVTAQVRSNLEQAFGCRLYDQYGAVESAHFVSQCEHGSYHVSPEKGIIEILNGDAPCPPGVPGQIVVTSLENTLQPLIRYEIGDAAFWAENQSCPCGREMPILGGIEGRFEDYCETKDGRRFLRFDPVFKGIGTIREGQVIQETMDSFTIKIVTSEGFKEEDERKLIKSFLGLVGDMKVHVEPVESISRTANGKFRAVVNRTKAASAS